MIKSVICNNGKTIILIIPLNYFVILYMIKIQGVIM